MPRVNGERFGRWSLRLDADYCAAPALAVTALYRVV